MARPTSTPARSKGTPSKLTHPTHQTKQWDDYAYTTLATITGLAALTGTAYACRSYFPSMLTDTTSHLITQSGKFVPSGISTAVSKASTAISGYLPTSLITRSTATQVGGAAALGLSTVGWGGYRLGRGTGHFEGFSKGYEEGHRDAQFEGNRLAGNAWEEGVQVGRECAQNGSQGTTVPDHGVPSSQSTLNPYPTNGAKKTRGKEHSLRWFLGGHSGR